MPLPEWLEQLWQRLNVSDMEWTLLSIVLIIFVLLLWSGSAWWAARIAHQRGHRVIGHAIGGLLFPLLYPVFLLIFLPRVTDHCESAGPPQLAPSVAPPPPRPAKIPFRNRMHRPIGRREEPLPAADAGAAGIDAEVAPIRQYFAQMMQSGSITHDTPLQICYGELEVITERLVEILPTTLVVETRPTAEAPPQCVRIPYARIAKCYRLTKIY